jgi:hypothetical protein
MRAVWTFTPNVRTARRFSAGCPRASRPDTLGQGVYIVNSP